MVCSVSFQKFRHTQTKFIECLLRHVAGRNFETLCLGPAAVTVSDFLTCVWATSVGMRYWHFAPRMTKKRARWSMTKKAPCDLNWRRSSVRTESRYGTESLPFSRNRRQCTTCRMGAVSGPRNQDEEIDLDAGDDPTEWSVYLTSIP